MGRTVKKVETKSKKNEPKKLVVHIPAMTPIRRINPAIYNPRKISPSDFDALKMSIRTFGFLDPVVVQKTGMCLIGGHQRVKALKELCVDLGIEAPSIPVIILDIEDRDARKLNVMLNNVGGEFDARMLGQLLADMSKEKPLDATELSFMGFEQNEADKLLRLVDAIPPLPTTDNEPSTFGRSITLSLDFNDVRLRDLTKKTLVDKSGTTGQKTGDFIAALLGCRVSAA